MKTFLAYLIPAAIAFAWFLAITVGCGPIHAR